MDKQDLINFEKEVERRYLNKELPYPIHFSGGNEKQLINIFKKVKKNDWVATTYRSHYHALLKSGQKKWLMDKIRRGKSIHIYSKQHRIISTAIVGGHLSMAVGLAMSIKRKKGKNRVWCFCGDMAATTGNFFEALVYSSLHNLPITFVIEDNGLSTDTPTREAWGINNNPTSSVLTYKYERTRPHYGCGKFVEFGK